MKITRAACLILLIGFQGALARDLPAQVGPNESELDRQSRVLLLKVLLAMAAWSCELMPRVSQARPACVTHT
jgi:hypothetical protein